ncbi:MAG: hypothetical protein L6Q83_10665, partial [Gammaproteobacteria bacterium]|nr:hypothetical protein [Gammaproteobacteria bacterium]
MIGNWRWQPAAAASTSDFAGAMPRLLSRLLVATLLALAATAVAAGPREQAKRMHDRLAGTPPDAATLDAMAADIAGGSPLDAALAAVEAPSFYNVTL